jgi:hypothetical protein
MSDSPKGAPAQPVIVDKVELCVAEIISTKPETVLAISTLLQRLLPPPQPHMGYYVAIYRRVIEIDPNNVARDMLGGTPTLTPLEVDVYARRLIRAPQTYRGAKSVAGQLALPDRALVLARVTEIRAGDHKAAGVIPFELKELS